MTWLIFAALACGHSPDPGDPVERDEPATQAQGAPPIPDDASPAAKTLPSYAPRPPIPDRWALRIDSKRDQDLDPASIWPLHEADLIAIGRVTRVEDICDLDRYWDEARTQPYCNRQLVTLVVEEPVRGGSQGEEVLVLKSHNSRRFVGGQVNDDWVATVDFSYLLMLQPAGPAGVREPLYARSAREPHRSVWVVSTPMAMEHPLLFAPYKSDIYACTGTRLTRLSKHAAMSEAQRVVSAPDHVPPDGLQPMQAYEVEVNQRLMAAWEDKSCEPATLAALLRSALQSGAAP